MALSCGEALVHKILTASNVQRVEQHTASSNVLYEMEEMTLCLPLTKSIAKHSLFAGTNVSPPKYNV